MVQLLRKTVWRFFKKLKIELYMIQQHTSGSLSKRIEIRTSDIWLHS